MKILLYEVRKDEEGFISAFAESLHIDVVVSHEIPTLENAHLAEGCDGISVLGQGQIRRPLLDQYKKMGILYLSTRTIGYNHIDVAYAKSIGIHVCNARYAPNGVADFAVMMILMCLRHYKQAIWRGQVNDFSLEGLQGRELKDLTVGVLGTGRIGMQVIQNLSGFGCKILAYDEYKNPSVEGLALYADLDTLYRECDVLTLHLPLTDDTRHIINKETLSRMKDGVVIVNCARGELADLECLVEGIESEKIGALGMDTVEGEEGIIHEDHRIDILKNRNWFYLHQFRNVIMTQHMAFYTDAAVQSMVEWGLKGICAMASGAACATEL